MSAAFSSQNSWESSEKTFRSVFRTIQRKSHQVGPSQGKIPPIRMRDANQPSLPEKRRYPRYEIDTELRVTILGLEQRTMMRGRSLNISEAGMAGVFVKVGGIGVPVHLEFSLPVMGSSVGVGGIVRSQSGYRYGFEFVDLSPNQREVISKTCRTLALLE
jgi:PilZ domain